MQRVRIHFSKGIELQYTGNLDLHKIWERTFRRAELPLAYSQGFHPQPRIQLASALPLGFTSSDELADVWIDTDMPLSEIEDILKSTAQPGLEIRHIESVPLHEDALQNRVSSCAYRITFLDPVNFDQLSQKINTLLEKSSVSRERRGKAYDLRPLIESLFIKKDEANPTILMQLTAQPSATGRPEEVLEELGIDPYSVDIERTQIILKPLEVV